MRNLTAFLLVLLLAAPAMAGTDFITYNGVETPDGVPTETQTRFSISKEMELLESTGLWGFDLPVHGSYTADGVGYLETDSAPFNMDHSVATFTRHDVFKWLSWDAGILHQSDGEAGDDSRSWNRDFNRGNVNWFDASGNFHVVGSLTVWHILNTGENSEYLHTLRSAGEGNWGLEGDIQVAYKDDLMFFGEFSKNFALTGVGFNPTGGDNTYMAVVGALTGKGQNLLEGDDISQQLFAGIALNPKD